MLCLFCLQSHRMPTAPLRAISCRYGTTGCTCIQLLLLSLGSGSHWRWRWRRWILYLLISSHHLLFPVQCVLLLLLLVCCVISFSCFQTFEIFVLVGKGSSGCKNAWHLFVVPCMFFRKASPKTSARWSTELWRTMTETLWFTCQELKSSTAHKLEQQRYRDHYWTLTRLHRVMMLRYKQLDAIITWCKLWGDGPIGFTIF